MSQAFTQILLDHYHTYTELRGKTVEWTIRKVRADYQSRLSYLVVADEMPFHKNSFRVLVLRKTHQKLVFFPKLLLLGYDFRIVLFCTPESWMFKFDIYVDTVKMDIPICMYACMYSFLKQGFSIALAGLELRETHLPCLQNSWVKSVHHHRPAQ